ncbi:TLC domain-containing protein 5-like [Patiria miniata]|uniref:TLC domain-containing protein n=1 Tax=Patiria miniata TaxID=46514 RepID=A0A914APD1_PATMI|nr:TLC domain-containing protein 5-like [Patiria miniata]
MEFTPAGIVLAVAALFTLWCALYVLTSLAFPDTPKAGRNRFVVTLNIIATLGLAVWCEFYKTDPCDNPGAESNAKETILLINALSGMLYDLFHCCCIGHLENLRQFVHHSLVIMMLSTALATGRSGSEVVYFLFFAFITLPMNSLLRFMRYHDMTEHIAYKIVDVTRAVLFLFLRVSVGAYVAYCYIPNPVPHILIRIPATAFNVVGLIFAVVNARRVYRQMMQTNQKVE